MDSSTQPILFSSRIYPEVVVTLNRPSYRTRFLADRLRLEIQEGDAGEKNTTSAWKAYVRDCDGVTIDGKKPSVESLLLDGPDDLVEEVLREIGRVSTRLVTTDAMDDLIIEEAERQKAEALERKEKRKNSGPATSPAITGAGTETAGDASATTTRAGESDPTATATA